MFVLKTKTHLFSLLLTLLLLAAVSANLQLFLNSERYFQGNLQLFIGSATALLTILLIATFASLTWQQKKEIRENEQFSKLQSEWEETFNTISDFVSVHDRNFRITKVNKSFCEFFDKTPEEIIGTPCYQLFHDRDEPIEDCPHVKANETGHPISIKINDPHLGFPMQITCSPFFDRNDQFQGSVHLTRTVGDPSKPSCNNTDIDFITVCASCKSIRDSKGMWRGLEEYFPQFHGTQCTHSICQPCQQKLYPKFSA